MATGANQKLDLLGRASHRVLSRHVKSCHTRKVSSCHFALTRQRVPLTTKCLCLVCPTGSKDQFTRFLWARQFATRQQTMGAPPTTTSCQRWPWQRKTCHAHHVDPVPFALRCTAPHLLILWPRPARHLLALPFTE
ncbi:hypothetical protein CGRA01v4_02778 [Colletotrichum graminicola]|nr:hypothetical protein CGRA01v4_02778 [Colletotrichum graminicola]